MEKIYQQGAREDGNAGVDEWASSGLLATLSSSDPRPLFTASSIIPTEKPTSPALLG